MTFVNNSLFKLSEIPNYNPLIEMHDRKIFWKGEKRKCIEGTWQSGKWMPGPLYYYINFHHIQVEAKGSKSLSLGLPWLRDIDWELFLIYEECRGFSGFADDPLVTCDRKYGPERELSLKLELITQKEIDSKTYIPARDYLRKNHGKNLGKPLYENEAKHFISIQSRGGGKSYASTGLAAHNFLFDGATDYDEYLLRKSGKIIGKKAFTSDTIIGAIDAKYTNLLTKKIKVAIDELPGKTNYLDVDYSSPLWTSYTGSLAPSKSITSRSNSVMGNYTFRDNPVAANGTRPNFAVLDEVGFMNNLQETWGALEATQASKEKTLVIWGLGTGGLVSGKAALYAEQVFRNPQDYNCVEFDDVFENRGKIGYFVPYTKTLTKFKDKDNNYETNLRLASIYVEHRRELAKASANPTVYQTEVINGPIKPSEAFLVLDSGEFPTFELKERLAHIEGNREKYLDSTLKGSLIFDNQGQVEFRSVQGAKVIRNFPLQKNDDRRGTVELFAHPEQFKVNGVIPRGLFIAGADVVDKDKSTTSSLPSILVMNRLTREIVAEYTGRTDNAKDFYEVCRKLTMLFNATLMYEKNLVGLFNHFDQYKCTYLLADTPHQLRSSDTYKATGNTSKGINATAKINKIGRDYTNSWLMEKLGINHSKSVVETLRSPAMIRELIMWNPDGNFDRVSALGMLLWHDATLYTKPKDQKEKEIATFLNDDYFRKQGVLIKN